MQKKFDIEGLLQSLRIDEAIALSHVVLKVVNGCVASDMALLQADSFGVTSNVLREVLCVLGFDPFTSAAVPLEPMELGAIAHNWDAALIALTKRASNYSETLAVKRLGQLRSTPIHLV